MKLFEFEIKIQQINGLNVSGEHNIYVVAENMERSLEIFNNDFKNDGVTILNTRQIESKVLIQRDKQ